MKISLFNKLILLSALFWFFLIPSIVCSGEFRVTPIRLDFDRGTKTGVVTIVNEGGEKLNAQMRAFEWSQTADGKDEYTETNDIIFFPRMMSLEKNEEKILRAGIKMPATTKEKTYRLFIEETSEKPLSFQDMKIFSKPMAHISDSVGYRTNFNDGKSIAVSGDTDYCQNIIDLAFEVDLLILECSFPDEKKVEGHLTPSLAGRIASESRCKKLLLTHFYPICDQFDILKQCRQVYDGETILGEDLMRIKI